jgi:calcineurin-like phosphoesterase family protein
MKRNKKKMSRSRRKSGLGRPITHDGVWFTSDLHFFHNNIIEYCDRPWRTDGGAPDVDAMREGIIRNWNSVVGWEDVVFIIGDLAMGGRSKAPLLAEILGRLNGHKYLVPGNHDTYVLESDECLEHITVLPPLFEIKVSDPDLRKGQRIVMCHYALKVWNRSHHGAWNLYGHSHHSMPPDYTKKAFDVGIDGPGYDYKPLSYAQVKNLMLAHSAEPVDHHDKRTNDGY